MSNAKVLLRAPAGCNGASWNGNWYECLDGLIEVPASAVNDLTRPIHGFVLEPEKAEPTQSYGDVVVPSFGGARKSGKVA